MSERVERRFRQVVNASRDAYVEADRQGQIAEWSAAAETLLGWTREEVLGRPAAAILRPKDAASVAQGFEVLESVSSARAHATDPEVFTLRLGLTARDGSTVAASARVFAVESGSSFRVCAFLRRVATDLDSVAEPLSADGVVDPRTRLLTRPAFDRRAAAALRSLDGSSSVAVVAFELDRFGPISDALGAEQGDVVLAEVADRLRAAALRSPGRPLLCHRGGAQYLALFRCADGRAGEKAERFAERFLQSLDDPVVVEGQELFLAASAGLCATRDPEGDASDLVSNAATAAYEGTRAGQGKGRVRKFSAAMRAELVERLATESALHHALERSELTVHYQPVVDMTSSSAVGVEALVRWCHPEQGVLLPERFIPVAEESGLIVPIGAWVLGEACRQLTRWLARPWCTFGSVEVNLSARQFEDPGLVELVRRVLADTRLPARALVCEITESTLMRDAETSLAVLRDLKAVGVVLAIDDFGTGFSSLSYLRHFPVDMLKIDKCFVQTIHEPESATIVAAIADLGHDLGMVVVTEGVETALQAQLLRRLGCDHAQGFWYAPPLGPGEIARLQLGRREA